MRYCLSVICLAMFTVSAVARDLPLHLIQLPPGFKISLYSSEVPNARSMSLSPSGTLFVGSRKAGKVYALRDNDGDGYAEKIYTIAEDLNSPNGVAYYNGSLFVAEINRILRYDDIEYQLDQPTRPVVISTDFPADSHHGWKFIRVGPDNKLYVPIGAPCNVCIEYGYAVITRLNLDGTRHEVYAEGVRNTVGFDWHPDTKQLWFTDNGRDMLGDDLPPDELNHAKSKGQHFGFPYCHGGEVIDPEYGLGHSCKEYVSPVQKLGAHVASLGMRFYTGKNFPRLFQKQVFIAEHGSWNRSIKTGYRITLVRLKKNKAVSYEIFAKGWLQGENAWGRPVDIETMRDGSLLVSDDKAGAIYRIYYQGSDSAEIKLESARQSKVQPITEKQPDPTPIVAPEVVQKQTTVKTEIKQSIQQASDISQQDVQKEKQEPSVQIAPDVKLPTPNENKPTEPPPVDIHEQLLNRNKQVQVEQEKELDTAEPVEDKEIEPAEQNIPPADLVEKIRQRTEQGQNQKADPFAPVQKQIVED